MTSPLKIVGIAGSLRTASYSRIVLDALYAELPTGSEFATVDIGSLPHYNEDVEHQALPEAVAQARTEVEASDAVVIVTPEFNHGLPGVLKNTLDWLSRPAFTSSMIGKPVFFATISPGALGGVRAQYQLRETLSSMLCQLVPMREIAITHVGQKITDGKLTDTSTLDFISVQVKQFCDVVTAMAPAVAA
ncbi:chromate reductase [Herbaspirillum sp. Sphag1AN]|uniref:NADPH-dependent FMN reductase n=1 Tax=unclassified Herbaspirillum TaxID=2624150 RepID=UPI0016089FEF|nr:MULTISPECIES: NADPH-dependent FMN reductase [unclassified Herbaspirillum]MBB3213201.1 chromate reductase [Herbaspirillum sp. Sphag1AN]MBB3246398.1 chromate reductase [Herbaspirillum sp. Sphag64]